MQTRTTQIIVLIAALLLGINNPSKAQTTNWNWLTQTKSTAEETSQGAVQDAQGNVYHAGIFAESFVLEGDTVTSWGGLNAPNGYVSRYTPGGPVSNNWTFVIGSRADNSILTNIRGLKADSAGNTTFWYKEFNFNFGLDTIQIGPNTYTIKGNGFVEISILVKLDPQGNLLWHKVFEFGTSGRANAIYTAPNKQGELYIVGQFGQQSPPTLTLDTITLTAIGINTNGHFLAKADANGNFIWAKSFGCKGLNGRNFQIEVNEQDEVFISGAWDGDTLFMEGFTAINPTPGGGYDRYIAKFNGSGQAQWLVNESGQGAEYAASLTPKASGGIMCLSILDTAASLSLNNGSISLNPPGVVLTQYDSQGNFESHKQYPINSIIDEITGYLGCSVSGDGHDFYMSSKYNTASLNLDGIILSNAGGNLGTYDGFIAKIDTAGTVQWAENIGSDDDEEIFSLAYSANNGLSIAGYTKSSELVIGNDTVVNAGFLSGEAFVANLSYSGIGLSELNNVKTISLYPNPTSGQLFFNLEETESEHITLKVENLIGQVVLEKTIDNKSARHFIDVQNLSPGLYLLNLKDGNKTYSGKFIKK